VKKANPAAVGAFVLGAVALVIVGVIALGGGALLRDTLRYVLFFEGSVNGLTVGSPVKIRGVEIGSVLEVNARSDTTRRSILNEVVIEIDPARFKREGPALDPVKWAQVLIEEGMRARLELQSFVTGQLYVGFDFHPGTPVKLMGYESEYPELPAIPSVSEEVATTVHGLASRLQDLPLEEIAHNLNDAIAGVKELVDSPDLEAALAELDETVSEVRVTVTDAREMVADARRLVNDVDAQVVPVADSAVGALDEARTTLASIDGAVQPGSDVRHELTQALEELTEAARAIRRLADYVERNPRSLVFGRESGGDQ
jgi:paraquat-inducible protein B